MVKYRVLGILCVILLIVTFPVNAEEGLPTLPAQYFGIITTDSGTPLPTGTTLTAKLETEEYTIVLGNGGAFGSPGTFGEKLIISPSITPSNKTISFWIGNTQTEETEIYQAGVAKKINLTVSLPTVSVQNQTAPTLYGRDIFPKKPVVICSTDIPPNFQIVITEVFEEQMSKLPSLPDNTKSILFVNMTPENPPEGPYTIIYPFTLQKSDIAKLGVEKSDIVVLHNTGSAWKELMPSIKNENTDGSIEYEITLTSFSVYLVAAKTDVINPDIGAGSGGISSGSTSGGGTGGSLTSSASKTTIPTTVNTQPTYPNEIRTSTMSTPIPSTKTSTASTLTQAPTPIAGLLLGLGTAILLLRRRS